MPKHTISLLQQSYGDLAGARVVILGAAYRGGVKETAFSGVFDLVTTLRDTGAEPAVHDPMYGVDELAALGMPAFELGTACDAAILHTDHVEYADLSVERDLPGCRVLVDGRATFRGDIGATVSVRTLGRP
jgi:UDP-N-acetyl-D-mannosaminuronate dehydrogenase